MKPSPGMRHFLREVVGWTTELVGEGMQPVALIAVDNRAAVKRVGMAGLPELTPEQLVTLLEECVIHARRRLPIDSPRHLGSEEGGAT